MNVFVFVVTTLFLAVQGQGPIDGVYHATNNGGCTIMAQIKFKNFLSYNICPGVNQTQVFMGVYSIFPVTSTATAGVITVTYTTILGEGGGPMVGQTLAFDWTKYSNGNLTLVNSQYGLVSYFTPSPVTAIDGIWSWNQGNEMIVVEMNKGLFLSESFDLNGAHQTHVTMGVYQLLAGNQIHVTYAVGPDYTWAGSYANGTYSLSTTLDMHLYLAPLMGNTDLTGGTKVPATNLEGVYQGVTTLQGQQGFCFTTGEFASNLFRGYQYQCSGASLNSVTQLGIWQDIGSGANEVMNFTYGFVDFHAPHPPPLQGVTLGLHLTRNYGGDPNSIRLQDGSGTTVQLTKVSVPPTVQIVEIHLTGVLADFTMAQQDAFRAALATALGIDVANIAILSLAEGSIIAFTSIQDDIQTKVTATQAVSTLSSLTSIGGYPVIGVTNVTPGGSGSGVNSATSMAVSCLTLLAGVAAAFALSA